MINGGCGCFIANNRTGKIVDRKEIDWENYDGELNTEIAPLYIKGENNDYFVLCEGYKIEELSFNWFTLIKKLNQFFYFIGLILYFNWLTQPTISLSGNWFFKLFSFIIFLLIHDRICKVLEYREYFQSIKEFFMKNLKKRCF